MGLRWRKDGRLLCSAMTKEEDGDVYFDDHQQYELSARGIIIADLNHDENALWHFVVHILPSWAMPLKKKDETSLAKITKLEAACESALKSIRQSWATNNPIDLSEIDVLLAALTTKEPVNA